MDQFHQGLWNDVKDLLLTFHDDPKSLTEAISRAMRYDNRLYECRSGCQKMLRFRLIETYTSVVATPPQMSMTSLMEGPTLMEIETTQRRGPL